MEDKQLFDLINREEQRQQKQLGLIPSENYVSPAVRKAVGSVLMNKYSEGQPDKRYYQGNLYIDQIEKLVKERALKLYKLDPEEWAVNVQAVTGSVANLAVLSALLEPEQKIMAMSLFDGGHLSHGWQMSPEKKVSFTSKVFQPVYYHVDQETGRFDYDQIEARVLKERPQIVISGGTAYPRQINHQRMGQIAKKVGAYYLADVAHEAGLIAGGVNDSPFEYANVVTMTSRKTLRGPIGALIFSRQDLAEKIDKAVFPGLQGGPQNHSIAGIGVALEEASQPEFKQYAQQVVDNAKVLAQELMGKGYNLASGGTDKHLILIDLGNKKVDGTQAALALEKANIIVNKNTVPNGSGKPWKPAGIRLGTPAVTTRSMGTKEMKQIAQWIDEVITNWEDESVLAKVAQEVEKLTKDFPVE